jgi:hypothetical protein
MKNKLFIFISYTLLLQFSCVTPAQQQSFEQIKAERKPFQKSPYVIKSPTEQLERELKNGKSYDPKPKAIVIDEKTGKYEFRWIGTDGKEKIVAYQRHDAIDGVIEAKVEKIDDGKFRYSYLIKIFSSSPSRLVNFIVYTKTTDAQPIEQENVHSGYRYPLLSVNDTYIWLSYYPMHEKGLIIDGGKNIVFGLKSSNLPGIVKFWASGGELGTKGVGEEIPSHLENQIPIFQDLAWGYTIGPVESLSTLSKSERAKYLLDNLPKFQEAGWMSEGTAKNYEVILKKEDLQGALEKAKKDLENEFITIEVFQIIEGLNQ